jgi:hypothetical protein
MLLSYQSLCFYKPVSDKLNQSAQAFATEFIRTDSFDSSCYELMNDLLEVTSCFKRTNELYRSTFRGSSKE